MSSGMFPQVPPFGPAMEEAGMEGWYLGERPRLTIWHEICIIYIGPMDIAQTL
jgi:hypothetical protein